MTRARLISAVAVAALLAAGAAATWVARPPWLFGAEGLAARIAALVGPAAPSQPADGRDPDPLGLLPRDLAAYLASPRVDAPSPFMRLARTDPETFCKAISRATGLRNAAFQKAEAPLRGWTCVTDLVKPVEGDEAKVSSLFVAARGLESDRIDNIRMKLNLLDPATATVVRAIARDVLYEICRSLGFEPPREVLAQLDAMKEGRVYEGGVSWDLKREFGPQTRYNLIVIFPRTLGGGGEDRFVSDDRRQPIAR